MAKPSYTAKGSGGYFVTVELNGCHPMHDYPLLPGDWVNQRKDGTWGKIAPGLGIEGFILTDEQVATLEKNEKELNIAVGGLDFFTEQMGRDE